MGYKPDDFLLHCGRCGRIIKRKESFFDYFLGRVCRECYEEMKKDEKNKDKFDELLDSLGL